MNRLPVFHRSLEYQDGIYRDTLPRRAHGLAQSSNFWRLTAQLYEPLWRHRSISILTQGGYSTKRELELLQEWLQPQAGERILDAACSAALYARTLLAQEPQAELHAVDMSLAFLRQAKHTIQKSFMQNPVTQNPITLVQADVQRLPYADASFDAIVCGGSLNEFYDVDSVMQEMTRVLKPNGRMWQMYLVRSDDFWRQRTQDIMRLTGIRFPKKDAIKTVCAKHGLDLVKSQKRGDVVMALFSLSS